MRAKLLVVLLLVCVSLSISLSSAADETSASEASTGTSGGGRYYDYIVVGGGATGSVIATRLAKQTTNNKVLVIDGGGPSQSSVGGTDFVAASYSFNSKGDAVYNRPLTRYDVPAFTYSAAADYPGSPTPYYPLDTTFGPSRGFSKLLGGNSVHNYMVWNRISQKSLNAWGLNNWSYSDLLPYFKKVEDVRGTTIAFNTAYHGYSGPIEITNAQVPDPIGQAFIKACVPAGYAKATDFNAPGNYVGCGDPVFNINRRGIRGGPVNQYLAPALKQYSNLELTMDSVAHKIIFDTSCSPPKAIGVLYQKNGTTEVAYAGKEVVLSGGAVSTPRMLLLSGIGPTSQLAALGITQIAELPVGKNMSTHPIIFTNWEYNATGVNPYALSPSGVEYAINGTGVFASIGVPAMAQLKSNESLPEFDLHVQVALAGGTGYVSLLALRLNFQRDLQVKLRSKDPSVAPFLVFNPFTRDEDVLALARAVKILRKIANTPPLSSYLGGEISPGPAYADIPQLKDWVRNGGGVPILTHLHGGAPMGNAGDVRAVTDTRARVKKVQNLRVADSSIIPDDIVALPTHNLVAFAEKIADHIIADNA